MQRALIISPSGSFYGSEQVLYDYLTHTTIKADVAIPANSFLYGKLREDVRICNLRTFRPSRLLSFYVRLIFDLMFNRYYSIYLNEGAHVKYILILAKLFPRKKFVIHVRIVEDTFKERWKVRPGKNVTILSISKFIAEKMSFPTTLLYDPFPFKSLPEIECSGEKEILTIGVIGRITYSKGLLQLIKLLDFIKECGLSNQYQFILFGTISEDALRDGVENKLKAFDNVQLAGFVSPKEKIYSAIDCVMHLSNEEPLGRIFLEAIDEGKPFVGINSGGIGEIASCLKIEHLMCDSAAENISVQLLKLLEQIRLDYAVQCNTIARLRGKAARIFNIDTYTRSIDKLMLR